MTRVRSILGGAAGNLVEWFDWYVYSAFSLYFAPVFFPGGDPAAQFLKTASVFWAGFLMRPIGGWLMGRIGDRHGRRTALALSVGMMGGGSLLLAATPGYAQIGAAAPALLLIARMLQGLSLGGEYGAAATYLSEVAEPERRGFWSSFQYVTLYGGQLLALGLILGMQASGIGEAALASWGWRVAFVVGAALAFGIFWLRRGLAESPDFVAEPKAEKKAGGIAVLWRDHRRGVLIAFGLAMGSNVIFYTFTTYMQKYLVVTSGFPKDIASRICAGATFLAILAQPPLGALSDRIGRKPLQYAFGFGGLLLTVPIMVAIGRTHDAGAAFGLMLCALAIISCSTATNAALKAELFPVHVRVLGVGLPYALSQSLFGGSAETLALALKGAGHEVLYFYYASAMAGVALIAAFYLRESAPRLTGKT
ncbi:MHS family alpha-ketoglutarate permease-like MFS transporter [Sphingomonas vulcanisoli]|uniref:MHS family alpha-ketoglutarate permease-like MFS transporter n=1 Tax=Sphingomonas vulcanisoli TaxID=1658060 RepID=A0ABX0TZQ1_9SPHN|nr:MHS family alpha-ketoglutarate permease-like MFS transporter [Sphingomonas vulcanisoli]